jgi:hypothetical protein
VTAYKEFDVVAFSPDRQLLATGNAKSGIVAVSE